MQDMLPIKRSVIGIDISVTTYDMVIDHVLRAGREKRPFLVTALAVHGVVEAKSHTEVANAIKEFEIVTPDGQPVRYSLNLLYAAGLKERVYGPTLMLHLCESAELECLPIYLYGSTTEVVTALANSLQRRFPKLTIAGFEPSIFRPLTSQESAELGKRIRGCGARLVFVGLGCPRQEIFAWINRDTIGLPQICVGAAFDFHSGKKRQAPPWMQDLSLEWLFRLSQEPRRLAGRYAVTNTLFLVALARQWAVRILRKEAQQ
jgi:N-acetylglucosaminyldiphosphoundecaprenol N-acetyl-beta-D-mannosaminyltransferase